MKKKNNLKEINLFLNENIRSSKSSSSETTDQALLRNVVVGAEKYELLDNVYLRAYGENYKKISNNVKDTYFNKLYSHITEIDLGEREKLMEVVSDLTKKTVSESLNKILLYFQDLEEYEKCAEIKKVLDTLKKS